MGGSSCLQKAGERIPAKHRSAAGLVLFWHDMWWPEFFKSPHTRGCPSCEFTFDKSKLSEAKFVVFSIPEWQYADFPPNKPEGQKWVYLCVEAGEEFPCFLHHPVPSLDRPSE